MAHDLDRCGADQVYNNNRNLYRRREPAVPLYKDRCGQVATVTVSSGCVHEHIVIWRVCTGCAAIIERMVHDRHPAHCVSCTLADQHRCQVMLSIAPDNGPETAVVPSKGSL